MAEGPKIKDVVVFGTPEDVSADLLRKAKELDDEANAIWQRRELDDVSGVYPGLLRTTARQLRILEASSSLPIEVAAGACRTTFEVNVRTRLVVADPAYLVKFQMEFVGDEQTLTKAFLKLSDSETSEQAKMLQDRLRPNTIDPADRRGLKSEKGDSVSNNARRADIFDEYDTLYRFYSKYVHGSGWLILATDDRRDGEGFRYIFSIQTQLYAADTLFRIKDAIAALASNEVEH